MCAHNTIHSCIHILGHIHEVMTPRIDWSPIDKFFKGNCIVLVFFAFYFRYQFEEDENCWKTHRSGETRSVARK